MKKHTFLKCLVLGIVASSAAFAGSLKAESALKTMSGERELLPKIWVPDPARSKRVAPHERMERARRLLAERGYNSTNKPNREVLNGILVETGVIRPNGGSKSPSRTASVSPTSTASPSQKRTTAKDRGKKGGAGAAGWIFLALVLLAGIVALVCRMTSGKDATGQFRTYQERVDRCLLTDRALRNVVTQRMLEEWAIIIRFFSSGDEPRRLCVPAVLFLWERIFEPKMSHDEVHELNKRIRRACGLGRVFSRGNFESTSGDVIREIGYEPAWRNWQQLGDYAYSASDRIGGGAKLETPVGFGASVYRMLKNWDGKFDHIMMLPIDWKRFFTAHPEFAERELLVRYGVLDAEEQRACAGRMSETPHQSEDAALKELLAKEPDNLQTKMLCGSCRQRLGDEETFKHINILARIYTRMKQGCLLLLMVAIFGVIIASLLGGILVGWLIELSLGWLVFALYGVPIIMSPISMWVLNRNSMMEYTVLAFWIAYYVEVWSTFAVRQVLSNGISSLMGIEGALIILVVPFAGLYILILDSVRR